MARTQAPGSDFDGIGAPAQRALTRAGYKRLGELSKVTEGELAKLHGMGPKALTLLRARLAEQGASFAKPKAPKT
jgi:hypothetical protein